MDALGFNDKENAPLNKPPSSIPPALIFVGALMAALVIYNWSSQATKTKVQERETIQTLEENLHQGVANDLEQRYEMAVRHGSRMDEYVAASLVTEAYLQAKDEDNYRKWRAIQRRAARRAGVSD
jgi:hypothetical protein